MAEEATTAPVVDAPAPAAAPSAEPIPADATNGETSAIPKEDEEIAGKQATTEVTAPDGEKTEVAEAPSAAVDHAVPAPPSSSKKEKRKSSSGVPEHKNKKLNKKKSMPSLHLDCQPGQHYWAKLKGYPPWPAIICDEQMLPESLLASRPVSTARPDGTIRDDFKEGGKNAKERTFPIMFLSTNEFTWMVNTNLEPLDPEQCKELPKSKMTKALSNAWKIASENHDLAYFKGILKQWQEEEAVLEKERREEEERLRKEAEERAVQEAADAEATAAEEAKEKKKAKSRKSKGGDADGDIDMEDADAPKSSKKRKKDAESDGEGKAKKTPKVTKLNAPKTPNGDSTKKSTTKSKKKVVQAPKEEEEMAREELTEEQKLEQREKTILYLRHRLQKGFLSRDQAPQESEMAAMATFFAQLEEHSELEPVIIRNTKVHKVLKGIVKLASIPKDDEYNFKKRSAALLEVWNKRMAAAGDEAPASAKEAPTESSAPATAEEKEESAVPETNGVSAPADGVKEAKEGAEKEVEAKAEEAADKLDEKVDEVAAPKDENVVDAPAETKEAVSEPKDVEVSGAVQEESTTAPPAESAA